MNFHILTLFPEMVKQGLSTSIIGRAEKNGLLSIDAVNIRDYTTDKHKKVDDYPYGGGAGMLMQAQPVYDAWKSVADRVCSENTKNLGKTEGAEAGKRLRTVYLTPQGATFTQAMAKELAREQDVVFLCGHYEGIDERVLEEIVTDYVSIGDYVLTGGELPAMVMIDAISRMVPGVLTNDVSGITESFEGNLLEYPQYSRPEIWMGKEVPQILLSGNQKKIDAWRLEEAEKRTKGRRPDLYARYARLKGCRERLKKQKLLHIDMTELIARGQAELLYEDEDAICLRDIVSGFYFLTAEDKERGREMLEQIAKRNGRGEIPALICAVMHQDFLAEWAAELLGLENTLACYQAVYTRKEKLPVNGLYRLCRNNGRYEEKNAGDKPVIRRMPPETVEFVAAHYAMVNDTEYIRERLEKGAVFGAYLGDEIVGFAGIHQEGSIGMLTVLPEYQGRNYGKALETYMINYLLEQGVTPFGQIAISNEKSQKLQQSLGLYFSKTPVYFLEKHTGGK